MFTSLKTILADVALSEQLVQPLEVFDIGSQMVEEHHVKEDSHDLRQRRVLLIGGVCLMLLVFTANPDGENLSRPQPYDRAERLLQAQTSVAEKSRSFSRLESYRLKHQRNGGRGANMIDGDLGRQGHSAASVPHRVAFGALNEEVTFS